MGIKVGLSIGRYDRQLEMIFNFPNLRLNTGHTTVGGSVDTEGKKRQPLWDRPASTLL